MWLRPSVQRLGGGARAPPCRADVPARSVLSAKRRRRWTTSRHRPTFSSYSTHLRDHRTDAL